MVEVQVAKVQTWCQLAQQLRADSIISTTEAGSGHPTSALSAADLMAVLVTSYLHYDFDNPKQPNNDRLIFSKGHACPLLYSLYKACGVVKKEELLSLRKFGSRLEGHPAPVLPWVDVASGSLGQGLPMAVGMALAARYLDKLPFRIWVLLGDSEMAEGSVWEAFNTAAFYKLDNITAILDMNRLGQSCETQLGWNSRAYNERASAFGWQAIEIDGHNYEQIDAAFTKAINIRNQPTLIIAKTEKGHGVSFLANQENWHGKVLSKEQSQSALRELACGNDLTIAVQKPTKLAPAVEVQAQNQFKCPKYELATATRQAYGDALQVLGSLRSDLVVLDAEVSNSTYSEKFRQKYPERYFEMYIAEQQMIGAAVGLATCNKIVFASTFAAFLSRAYDFIRMAAISRANIRLCGSHAGVSIGQDGPSQMALEDLAMMRAVYGSTVLYPSDAVCAAHLVALMASQPGISYIRTTREKTPIIYGLDESFHIGGSKTLRSSNKDQATLVAAGITLHESLKAYEELKSGGINVRVIDLYSVKPIDADSLMKAAAETGWLIVVEDHWTEGGVGDAVLAVFASNNSELPKTAMPRVIKLAVTTMPGSGTPAELLSAAGISAQDIVKTVQKAMR